jgi:hypothetical protein
MKLVSWSRKKTLMRFMSETLLHDMKTKLHRMATIGALGMALTLTSCVNPYAGPNQQNGAVIGAVGGGLLGAMIGNQSGRPLEGAAIGGLLGSFAGSQIGASRDQRFYHTGNNRFYSNRYYGVRNRPVYVHRTVTPYRYGGWGYSPYRNVYSPFGYGGWGAPYRSGLSIASFGRPAFGYGSGWGYNPYCW